MIRAVAFDFDGVIVESVNVKTQAFAHLFEAAGPDAVERVVAYHLANGGVSRIEKFRYYYREILQRPLPDEELTTLSQRFRELVFDGVVTAPWVAGAPEALQACHDRGLLLYVVSGTPEPELNEIVGRRGLAPYFAGVFGSPRGKGELLRMILHDGGMLPKEMLFVGDALTDWEGAQAAGVQFVARSSVDGPDWAPLEVPVMADLTTLPEFVRQLAGRGR